MDITLPHEIKLDYPIEWGEDIFSTITVNRRIKSKDMKNISANDIKYRDMFHIASKITGKPLDVIEDLDFTDFMKLSKVIEAFLPGGPETGDDG